MNNWATDEEINWHPKGQSKWGPLHLAAACGDIKGLLALVDYIEESEKEGASGDIVMEYGSTAARSGKKNKKPTSKLELASFSGDRAFHVALRNGQCLAARELARAGCDIHAKGKNGETAAHICAANDLANELTWMIECHGLNPAVLSEFGETIIHFAARNCRISFLDWAVVQPFATYQFFCTRDSSGSTCLHEAAKCGIRVGVQWLLDYFDKQERQHLYADPLAPFCINSSKKDPCALARMEGHYFVATMLEEYRDKKIAQKRKRRQKYKQLTDAIRVQNLRSVQQVVHKNTRYFRIVDILDDRTSDTAILEAARSGSLEIFQWLLSQPGERNFVHVKTKETILHKASRGNNVAVAKYIKENNLVDSDAKDSHGKTALQYAVESHHRRIIELLDKRVSSSFSLESATAVGEEQSRGSTAPETPSKRELEKKAFKDWFVDLDMVEWHEKLCDEGFDSFSRLFLLEEHDLKDLGMKTGYRRSFLQALGDLKVEKQGTLAPPSPKTHDNSEKIPKTPPQPTQRAGPSNAPTSSCKTVTLEELQQGHLVRDLIDGEMLRVQGYTKGNKFNPKGEPRTFTLRRAGNVYECSCSDWKYHMNAKEVRTCTHLKALRGEKAERTRVDLRLSREFDVESIRSSLERKLSIQRQISTGSVSTVSDGASSSQGTANNGTNNSTNQPGTMIRSVSATSSQLSFDSLQDYVGVPAHQVLSYDELTFGQVIGEGSFGIVRAAEWRGMLVAVKELRGNEKLVLSGTERSNGNPGPGESGIKFQRSTSGSNALLGVDTTKSESQKEEYNAAGKSEPAEWDLKHEAGMMSRVSNHENIVPFVGVLLTPRPSVVTKLMRRGSVEDMLVIPGPWYRRNKIPKENIVDMLIDAAAGILHLHSEGVIHRDIAARNLLVDENFRVRVADFGFARIKEINQSKGYTNQNIGPIKWMSPEAIRFRTFSEQSDVFSFGVTLFEVLVGKRPWDGILSMDVVVRVCRGEKLALPSDLAWSELLQKLVMDCQDHEPARRPSMKMVHKLLVSTRSRSDTALPLFGNAASTDSATYAATTTSPDENGYEPFSPDKGNVVGNGNSQYSEFPL